MTDASKTAKSRDPIVAFTRYGTSNWATSSGRSLDIRIGRFYLFIDFGRIHRG